MGSYNRVEGGVCAEEKESLFIVKREKRGSKRVYQRAVEKKIHLTIKVTTNGTSILCREKGWEEVNGTRLPIFEQVDDQEQLSSTFDIGYVEEYKNKESVH